MVSEIEENPKLKTAISTKGSARRLKEKEESKARRLEKKEISGKAWKEIIKYKHEKFGAVLYPASCFPSFSTLSLQL